MKKNIIFSLLFLVILGGTVALLKLTEPKPIPDPEPSEPEQQVTFAEFDAGDLLSVHVKNKLDEYNIEKGDDGYYVKEISVKVPYSASLFADAANGLADIKSYKTVELNAEDLDKYGLSSPKSEVDAVFTGGEVAFCVGDDAPVGMTVYFCLKNSSDVYAVTTSTLRVFEKERFYFIERKVAPDYDSENAPTISRVLIERRDLELPIIIESLPERPLEEVRTFNTHRLISPIRLELEQEKASSVVYGFFGLTAQTAVWAGLEAFDYEHAGLNNPTCRVELTAGGRTYTLTIGAAAVNDDGEITGWYGVCGEMPDILYTFAPGTLPWVYVEPEELMAQMFLTPYIYSLDELTLETADKRLTFKISGDADNHAVTLDNVKADEERFKDLYMFLVGAKGEWVFTGEEPDSEFIARVTYRYKNAEQPDDVIEYYGANDRKSVIRINGENIFKCRDIYTSRLIGNINAYLNGGTIFTDW